jgi:hypothetical protein
MYLSFPLLMKRLVRPCNADPEVPPAIIWLDGKFALETWYNNVFVKNVFNAPKLPASSNLAKASFVGANTVKFPEGSPAFFVTNTTATPP